MRVLVKLSDCADSIPRSVPVAIEVSYISYDTGTMQLYLQGSDGIGYITSGVSIIEASLIVEEAVEVGYVSLVKYITYFDVDEEEEPGETGAP